MVINTIMKEMLESQNIALVASASRGYYLMQGRKRTKCFNGGKGAVKALESFLGDSSLNEEEKMLMGILRSHSYMVWLPEVYRLERMESHFIRYTGNEPMCLYDACGIILRDLYQDYSVEKHMGSELPIITPTMYYEDSMKITPKEVMVWEDLDSLDELVKFIVEEIFPYTLSRGSSIYQMLNPYEASQVSFSEVMLQYGAAGEALIDRYYDIR